MSKNVVTFKSAGPRSLKVIESGTIRQTAYGFLLVFYSNFVSKTRRFSDIRLVTIYSDLETRVRGHSNSSEPTLIDPPPMISY